MDVVRAFLDLANRVAREESSLDKTVAEICSQRIKALLDEEIVAKLNALAEYNRPLAAS